MSEPHIWFYRKKLFEDSGVVYERHEDFKKQESLDGYNIPSVQLVEKSTLDEARKEIERLKWEHERDCAGHVQVVDEIEAKLARANGLVRSCAGFVYNHDNVGITKAEVKSYIEELEKLGAINGKD